MPPGAVQCLICFRLSTGRQPVRRPSILTRMVMSFGIGDVNSPTQEDGLTERMISPRMQHAPQNKSQTYTYFV